MDILLYSFAPQDRSGKIRWLLEELEVPFSVQTLNGDTKEQKEGKFLSISPLGIVPVIQHGQTTMFESGAIAMYLTEKFPSNKVYVPEVHSPDRADYLKWLFMATASLDPLLVKVFRTKHMSASEKESHLESIYADFKHTALMLESILENSEYIVANKFSAADIMLSQPLDWVNSVIGLEKHPSIKRYLERLKSRPACIKAGTFPH